MSVLTPKKIPTAALVRELLLYDPKTGIIRWKHPRYVTQGPGLIATSIETGGYLSVTLGRRRCRAHRIAWLYYHGEWPGNRDIDHANGNRLDNRLANLRLADRAQNNANAGPMPHSSHGIKGITRARGKWQAQIGFKGKNHYLGLFATPEAANAAYHAAALKFYGKFARAE